MKKLLALFTAVALCSLLPAPRSFGTDVTTSSHGTYKHENTGTTSSHAVTMNNTSGVITTEALTTAGLAAETITVTDSFSVAASSIIYCTVENGTNSAGTVVLGTVKPGDGSFVVVIQNIHASVAVSGTLKIRFWFAP